MKVEEKAIKLCANYFAISVILLIGLAPFFRGLFFEREMNFHLYGASALALCAIVVLSLFRTSLPDASKKMVNRIWRSPYFIALTLLMLWYGISFFSAINPRLALYTWLRQIDYFMVFIFAFVATVFMYGEKKRAGSNYLLWILLALTAIGTVVAVIAIAAAQGFVAINGALVSGRLSSTLQYPNTLAAYLTVPFLTGIHLAALSRNRYGAALSASMSFLILLTVLGTQSRGAWMMIPLFIFLYWLGQKDKKRNLVLLSLLFAVAIAVSSMTVGPEVQLGHPNGRALLITLASALSLGGTWFVLLPFLRKWEEPAKVGKDGAERNEHRRWASIGTIVSGAVVLAILFIGAYVIFSGSDNPVLQRIMSISTGDNNFRERLVFYSDAFRMGLERPLLGWGGGGWKAGYRAYQSFLYNTTEVHNHFLQVWVETGIIGFVSFISLFLMMSFGLYSLWRNSRRCDNEWYVSSVWTIGISALALAMHSAMDFNLSLSAVALLLWALIGVYAACEQITGTGLSALLAKEAARSASLTDRWRNHRSESFGLLSSALLLMMLPMTIFPFLFRDAESEALAYASALDQKDVQGALHHLQQAMASDPWKADYPSAMAQLLVTNHERASDEKMKVRMLEESERYARKAVETDAFNAGAHMLLAQVLIARGNYEEALTEAEIGKACSPWLVTAYLDVAKVNSDVALRQRIALARGQAQPSWKSQSERALNRVIEIATEASGKKETLPPALRSLWRHQPDLTLTPELALMAGKAAVLLGDADRAESLLASATAQRDDVTKALAELWRGAALKKRGDHRGDEMMEAARSTSLTAASEYTLMKQLGL
ncbi:O-antigen ligase family protein [Heliomicrobium modesticaldum]|nr:O-antigen ligase family protein [Heliomicrobium modesticaldum]